MVLEKTIGGTKCISTVFLVVHAIEMHANIKYRSILKKIEGDFILGGVSNMQA